MTSRACLRLRSALIVLGLAACSPRIASNTPAQFEHPPTQRWLLLDGKRAEIAGAKLPQVLVAEAGAVGDRFSSVVEVGERDCLLVMARGSERVVDLDLYTYSEDGSVLSIDDLPNATPTLLICPPHPRHVYITARIATGQGLVAVGVHQVPIGSASPVRQAFQIAEVNSGEPLSASLPDFEAQILSHHRSIGGNWVAVAQSSIEVDARVPTVTGILIHENSCVDLLVVPTPAVSALEVELIDDQGFTRGRAPVGERARWLIACSRERRSVTLQVRPHDGYGTVTVLVSRASLEVGHSIHQTIELTDSQPLQMLTELQHKALNSMGYSREKLLGSFSIERGFQRRFVTSGSHACTRFDVFAGAPSTGVRARLYTASGELLSAAGGVQHFPLLACLPGPITMVLEAQGRGGPVQVEQRREVTESPLANSLPRAAARMFQRAWGLGLAQSFDQFSSLESMSMGEDRVWEREISLGPGQCRCYFIALDGDATGVDLRVIDPRTDEIVAGEQHMDTAHAEICSPAGEQAHTYRLSATLQSGKSAVLFSSIPK